MWPQIFFAVAYYLLRMRIFEIALFRLHYLLFYLLSLIKAYTLTKGISVRPLCGHIKFCVTAQNLSRPQQS